MDSPFSDVATLSIWQLSFQLLVSYLQTLR